MRKLRFLPALLIIIATSWCCRASAAELQVSDLVGVWSSTRSFGPPAVGEEIRVTQTGDQWRAEDAHGFSVRSQQTDTVAFTLAGEGDLRVRFFGPLLVGQWIQPPTASMPYRFATPIRLTRASDGSWRGLIRAIADVQRVDLVIERKEDGTFAGFIRNPEENFGARIGMRTVTVSGNHLTLSGTDAKPLIGTINTAAETIALHLDRFPGDFVFRRSPPAPMHFQYLGAPQLVGDGWKTGSLRDAGIDEQKIGDLILSAAAPATSTRSPYIQSILIARHGKLVLDEYLNGYDRTRPHDVRSAGKSVATLMVGAALADDPTLSPSTPLTTVFPQYVPFASDNALKQRISIGDLMAMSSGLACDDNDDASPGLEDTMQSQTAQPDWYRFTLDLPMVSPPGAKAAYCSAGVNLLGGVVTKASKQWLPDFFFERFALPMQFGQYGMWLTPPPLDTAYMAGGDYFLPRDFLKFGQLFLDHGSWNGHKIIDDAWLQASVTPRSALNAPGDYGYGWHLLTYTVNGQTYQAYNAGGNGGQLLIVVPKLDTAIMITAANYGQFPVWQSFINDLVPKYILPAELPR